VHNILLVGHHGFVGSELHKRLGKEGNNVFCYNIDWSSRGAVDKLFSTTPFKFDFIINCAARGGRRLVKDDMQVYENNVSIFMNLAKYAPQVKGLFTFCSGRAYGEGNLMSAHGVPKPNANQGWYGLSKAMIAQTAGKIPNAVVFRLFGCFGELEPATRLLASFKRSAWTGEKLHIDQNYFDLFSVKDVGTVVDHYLRNYEIRDMPKDLNLVYYRKYTIPGILEVFNRYSRGQVQIKQYNGTHTFVAENMKQDSLYDNYTGSSAILDDLSLPLEGLVQGIKTYAER